MIKLLIYQEGYHGCRIGNPFKCYPSRSAHKENVNNVSSMTGWNEPL